jgi:hypothetical protein
VDEERAAGQLLVQPPQARSVGLDGEAGDLPRGDEQEPDDGAGVAERGREELLTRLEQAQPGAGHPTGGGGEVPVLVRVRRRVELLVQVGEVPPPDLLGDEHPAGAEHPRNLAGVEGLVPVEDQVEPLVGVGQAVVVADLVDLDAPRCQRGPGDRDVGPVSLGGSGVRRQVLEAAQQLAAAGAHVQHGGARVEASEPGGDQPPVVPRRLMLPVAVPERGEVPPLEGGPQGLLEQAVEGLVPDRTGSSVRRHGHQ